MARPLEVRVDTSQWSRLSKELKAFDPALMLALRRRIRAVGSKATDAVKEALRASEPGPGSKNIEALVAGTSLRVSFGIRSAGVTIVTSGKKLPEGHAGFERVWNMGTFRHPLFGNTEHWYNENGRPYFGDTIKRVADREMLTQIEDSLRDAMLKIGAS